MRLPYINARLMTADMLSGMQSRGADIFCTVAGNVAVVYKGGAIVPYPIPVGRTRLDDVALVGFTAAGTTATGLSVYLLD